MVMLSSTQSIMRPRAVVRCQAPAKPQQTRAALAAKR